MLPTAPGITLCFWASKPAMFWPNCCWFAKAPCSFIVSTLLSKSTLLLSMLSWLAARPCIASFSKPRAVFCAPCTPSLYPFSKSPAEPCSVLWSIPPIRVERPVSSPLVSAPWRPNIAASLVAWDCLYLLPLRSEKPLATLASTPSCFFCWSFNCFWSIK